MRGWLLWILLLASVGLNVGLLGGFARGFIPLSPQSAPEPFDPSEPSVPSEPAESAKPAEAVPDPIDEPLTGAPPAVKEAEAQLFPAAGPRLERFAQQLGLSGEARKDFIGLQRTFLGEVRQRRSELERLQRAVQREVMSDDPNPVEIRRVLSEVGDAYARLDAAFVQNILRSREYLEPDQERRFLEFLGRMRLRAKSGEKAPLRQRQQRRRPGPRRRGR